MKRNNTSTDLEKKDLRWIEKIRKGDENSFEDLVLTFYEPLCNFVYRMVQRSDVAEDLIQELFVKIWEIRQDWDPSGSIKAYLFKAAKNNALNYLDHQKVVRKQYSSILEEKTYDTAQAESKAEQLFNNQAFNLALQSAVKELPKRTKLVYTLHRQEGFKYSEIAWIMDISQKTVESQMTRALRSLREKLKHFYNPAAAGVFVNLII